MNDPVKTIFSTMLDIDPESVVPELTPDDLENWDSMQHMILVSGIEEELGIEIEPEEAVEMYRDYATLEGIVRRKLSLA